MSIIRAFLLCVFVSLWKSSSRTDAAAVKSQVKAECDAIILRYLGTGHNIKQCTVRYDPLAQTQEVYWKVADCLSWEDAKNSCGIAGGSLASFPLIDDKMYLVRFISPFTNAHNSQTQHCMIPNNDERNYGVWIGLSRKGSTEKEWNWIDGSTELDEDLPWDYQMSYWGDTRYILAGNCGYAGWGTACCGGNDWAGDFGYLKASCDTLAHAVCVKVLS